VLVDDFMFQICLLSLMLFCFVSLHYMYYTCMPGQAKADGGDSFCVGHVKIRRSGVLDLSYWQQQQKKRESEREKERAGHTFSAWLIILSLFYWLKCTFICFDFLGNDCSSLGSFPWSNRSCQVVSGKESRSVISWHWWKTTTSLGCAGVYVYHIACLFKSSLW